MQCDRAKSKPFGSQRLSVVPTAKGPVGLELSVLTSSRTYPSGQVSAAVELQQEGDPMPDRLDSPSTPRVSPPAPA